MDLLKDSLQLMLAFFQNLGVILGKHNAAAESAAGDINQDPKTMPMAMSRSEFIGTYARITMY